MSRYRVLIMERDARVSRVLSRIIKKMSHDPYTAGDYEHFKRLYAQTNPDLILLSLDSDDSDAANAEFLRFLVGEKTEATICLLGGANDEHFASLAQLGQSALLKMGGIIQKPLDVDSLKSRLDELMLASADNPQKKSIAAGRKEKAGRNRIASDVDRRGRRSRLLVIN